MVQQILVVIIGVVVAAYVVYHIVRVVKGKSPSCHCGCSGCPSASRCDKETAKKGRSEEFAKKNGSSACRIEK